MNQNKLLTINSQPRVNGAKSTDPSYGWGPEKGYVYQKAYIELFVHDKLIQKLVEHLNLHEDLTYQAVNILGQQMKNVGDSDFQILRSRRMLVTHRRNASRSTENVEDFRFLILPGLQNNINAPSSLGRRMIEFNLDMSRSEEECVLGRGFDSTEGINEQDA